LHDETIHHHGGGRLGLVGFLGILMAFSGNKPGIKMDTMQQATTDTNTIHVTPISHATFVLNLGDQVIYNDPIGDASLFTGQPKPNIILVSHIHQDHFSPDTLKAILTPDTIIVVPQVVKDQLPTDIPGTVVVMNNGATRTEKGIEIQAIPMYNVPESATSPHPKGLGNGYVLSANGERVYIAGDTGVTPEMKALKDITVAFVPMNPPYTMSVEEAAEGVLAFKPKVVHPYHYRSPNGLQDVGKFKQLVESKDPNIKVELLNFYPE
jgi:L-ascorbate metabolism protein UlaG (beta-lactamase superfamily)